MLLRLRLCALLGVGALAALSACDSPLTPSQVAGTYVLTPVPPASLPAVVYENEWGVVYVLADTLYFHADGRGERVQLQRVEQSAEGASTEIVTVRSAFGFRMRGDRLEIGYVCPPDALCAAPPHEHGRWRAGTLELESLPAGLVFQRVHP